MSHKTVQYAITFYCSSIGLFLLKYIIHIFSGKGFSWNFDYNRHRSIVCSFCKYDFLSINSRNLDF